MWVSHRDDAAATVARGPYQADTLSMKGAPHPITSLAIVLAIVFELGVGVSEHQASLGDI
jgi:hypothetical protein